MRYGSCCGACDETLCWGASSTMAALVPLFLSFGLAHLTVDSNFANIWEINEVRISSLIDFFTAFSPVLFTAVL
jgi:hypothetical protein